MIGRLTGKILAKTPPEVLLEVGGISYEVLCPMPIFYAMRNEAELTLHTHFHVKEDAQTLYGFISKDEKTVFRELIRVNGIGPKVALAVLSHLDVVTLMTAIANNNDVLLTKTPGIGRKTAQKLIVELKDRLAKFKPINVTNSQATALDHSNPNTRKALSALQALGFKVTEAEKMLSVITDSSLSTEQLIRLALQNK